MFVCVLVCDAIDCKYKNALQPQLATCRILSLSFSQYVNDSFLEKRIINNIDSIGTHRKMIGYFILRNRHETEA